MSKDKYPCIFLKTNGDYCVYYPSNIFRTVARAGSANLSTSKTFTAYKVDFFVFSGTAFSTSKFMSSSETTAKRSPILNF